MAKVQGNNLISILSAACGNDKQPLHQPDWPALVKFARTQSLTALFYVGACQYDEFASWDAAEYQKLQLETIVDVAAQAQRTQRFLALYQELIAAGLRPIVLKGILCRNLYGELADYRPSCDEDLYIPPTQMAKADEVLKQNGWRMTSHPESLDHPEKLQVIGYEDSAGILPLEIHPTWSGTGSPQQAKEKARFAGADERAITVEIEGVPLLSLNATDHYLYLYLHLVKHFEIAGVGLRQILDLAQFQRALAGQIDWRQIRKDIQALSSPGLYADVMALAQRLGFKVDGMFRQVEPDRLLEDCLEGGVFGSARPGHGRGAILSIAARYPSGTSRAQRLLFPSVAQLQDGRPWLVGRPWLLPVAWAQRAGRLLFDSKWSRITLGSLKEARLRLKLLRQYGLLAGKQDNERTSKEVTP